MLWKLLYLVFIMVHFQWIKNISISKCAVYTPSPSKQFTEAMQFMFLLLRVHTNNIKIFFITFQQNSNLEFLWALHLAMNFNIGVTSGGLLMLIHTKSLKIKASSVLVLVLVLVLALVVTSISISISISVSISSYDVNKLFRKRNCCSTY